MDSKYVTQQTVCRPFNWSLSLNNYLLLYLLLLGRHSQ